MDASWRHSDDFGTIFVAWIFPDFWIADETENPRRNVICCWFAYMVLFLNICCAGFDMELFMVLGMIIDGLLIQIKCLFASIPKAKEIL